MRNYLMNSVFINFSHFNNFKYVHNVHIVVHGDLALRFKPVVWKSIILNCHLLNCGTENRKSPTVLRDVHRGPSLKDVSPNFRFLGTLPPLVSPNLLVNVSFLGIFCTLLPPPLGRRLLWMVPCTSQSHRRI